MYREIAAKTLIGKGKLATIINKNVYIDEDISKTLGCWIINLKYETTEDNGKIVLKGSFDIQLWYASNNDQKSSVYTETIEFEEPFIMSYRDLRTISEEKFIKVYVSHYPTCIKMELASNGVVSLKIESLFLVDCFAEAILVVNCADDYKEDISIDEEILMNVNPNYLENK